MNFLTSQDVKHKTFATGMFGNYYDANQVDDFLDDVEATLCHYEHPSNTQRITDQLADAIAARVIAKLKAGEHDQ